MKEKTLVSRDSREWLMIIVLVGAVAFMSGLAVGKRNAEKEMEDDVRVETVSETRVDTVTHRAPVALKEIAAGTQRYVLPRYCLVGGWREDSENSECSECSENSEDKEGLPVELPTVRRHYADSTYEAWVSGPVDPRLDSLRVYARTTTVTRREWKPPKRWHIGVTAGYGYGPGGFQPFVGIGISYSLFSW